MDELEIKEGEDEGHILPCDIRTFLHGSLLSPRAIFSLSERFWTPPTDVYETADTIVVKMEIAGLKEDEIEIVVKDNYLHIRGNRIEETPNPKKRFHIVELHYGTFMRTFELPNAIKKDDISAVYKDGFLKIAIPKEKVYKSHKVSVDIKEEEKGNQQE